MKNEKSTLILGKKGLNCVHPYLESSIENAVLRVPRRKSSKIFACRAFFFLCFWQKVYRSALTSQNLPCPENLLVALLVRTVYLGIFWPIQGHSTIFSHVQPYWGTLRHFESYLGIIEACGAIIKNIRNSM